MDKKPDKTAGSRDKKPDRKTGDRDKRPDKTPDGKNPSHRGSRHLRVGVEMRERSASIASMWVVNQPAVQAGRLVGPVLTRVDIAMAPALLQGFEDPRIARGIYRKDVGHAELAGESGVVYVSIPFDRLSELSELRVRVIDATHLAAVPVDPQSVAGLFDAPPRNTVEVTDFNIDALRKHRDFVKVAAQLGLPYEPGRFEIYADRLRQFRWRLHRPNGDVAAESAQAYPSREACEEDIRWIRSHAAAAGVVSLDLPAAGASCA